MEIDYKKNKLKRQLSQASEIKKNFGVNAKRIAMRLEEIESSPTLAVLMQIPAANCHLLSGSRQGQWAVDLSGNFRLIFELDHDPIPKRNDGSIDARLITKVCIIEIVDYH